MPKENGPTKAFNVDLSDKLQQDVLNFLSLDDKAGIQRFADAHGFEYVDDIARYESSLYIAPVSVINSTEKVHGLFAKKTIVKTEENQLLVEYVGKRVPIRKTNRSDFLFKLNSSTSHELDADKLRSASAMINSTSSAMANVYVREIDGRVFFYLKRTILEGEQLLISYGQLYEHSGMKYLRTQDYWGDSQDIIKHHRSFYSATSSHLPLALAAFLGFSAEQEFVFPKHHALPLIAQQADGTFAPQHSQENLTLLMLACWNGDAPAVRQLLGAGANPNIQSSISGLSALHLVMKSSATASNKKSIVSSLIRYGAALYLQDQRDLTALHMAIEEHAYSLVEQLLQACSRTEAAYPEEFLLNCVNSEKKDAFLYAIEHQFERGASLLLQHVDATDIKQYVRQCRQKNEPYLKTVFKGSSIDPKRFVSGFISILTQDEVTHEGRVNHTQLKAKLEDMFIKKKKRNLDTLDINPIDITKKRIRRDQVRQDSHRECKPRSSNLSDSIYAFGYTPRRNEELMESAQGKLSR